MKYFIALLSLLFVTQAHALESGIGWKWKEINNTFQAGGDIRYRNETLDRPDEELRWRQKIRLRAIFAAKITEEIHLITRLGSGPSDSPVSSNQTLDGDFTSKPLWIDVVSLQWEPSAVEGLTLAGGKVRNPFRDKGVLQLIFDIDISPEGMWAKYRRSLENGGVFVNAGSFIIDERADGTDVRFNGFQAGIERNAAGFDLAAGAGMFVYSGAKGHAPFYQDTNSHGNTVDSAGNYAGDFEVMELFTETEGAVGPLPVKLYLNGVSNHGADEDNLGYGGLLILGKKEKPGSFDVRYEYKYLEKDSVVGVFTDNSFAGSSTDGRRHKVLLGCMLAEKVLGNFSWQINTMGLDNGKDYHVFQFDVICWL